MTTTPSDFVIVGAGGHGREVLDIVEALGYRPNFAGFVDDADPDATSGDRLARRDATIIGSVDWLGTESTIDFVIGIGTSAIRRKIETVIASGPHPRNALTLVHPQSIVGSECRLEPGVIIGANSTLTTNVQVGRHTHINVGCAVQHDSSLGDYVTVSPGVFVNGDVSIGHDVFIGTGAVITRGVTIGNGAVIGAGAVVLHDVAADSRVFGTPARPRRA